MSLTYDELKKEIEKAPLSWLPALLITAAQACYERNALSPGGASKIVGRVEAERSKEPHQ